ATKVHVPTGPGPNEKGMSRKQIIEQYNARFKRMWDDYIDLYYCHRSDEETSLEEHLSTLNDLIQQRKILYYGVSQWNTTQITDAVHITEERKLNPIISNQPVYNMLVRDIEKEVIPVSKQNGISQIVFSPLAQGILTG